MALIHEKLVAVMGEVSHVAKGNANREQGFKYRGIDDIYAAYHAALVKHGVLSVPRVTERREDVRMKGRDKDKAWEYVRLAVEYDFVTADGSKLTLGPIWGEGQDAGDKAANKALAIAHKYAFIQLFCIPTWEPENDPDAVSPPETVVDAEIVRAIMQAPTVDALKAAWDGIPKGSQSLYTEAKDTRKGELTKGMNGLRNTLTKEGESK